MMIAIREEHLAFLHGKIKSLEDKLKNQQKPIELKRKTLGEIAEEAAWPHHTSTGMWPAVAKAVAESIIDRYIYAGSTTGDMLIAAIRKEFEE